MLGILLTIRICLCFYQVLTTEFESISNRARAAHAAHDNSWIDLVKLNAYIFELDFELLTNESTEPLSNRVRTCSQTTLLLLEL